MKKKYYKRLFYLTAMAVFVLAIVPNDYVNFTFPNADKLKHFVAFFMLSLLLNRASSTLTHRLRNIIALLLFGILIELVQKYIVYRSSSIYDIVADLVGILLFQFLFSLYKFIQYKRKQITLSSPTFR